VSEAGVRAILAKAGSDAGFLARLKKSPGDTLRPFRDKGELTDMDVDRLQSISDEVWDAIAAETAPSSAADGPSAFRERGAFVFTAFLAALLLVAVIVVAAHVGRIPTVYKVGDATQTVDSFNRSQELLNVLFPLFTAAFSFWFGASIEARRAEGAQAQAQTAQSEAKVATSSASEALTKAADANKVAALVLQEAGDAGKDALERARAAYPALFERWVQS
jgi:hypothetical protein